MEDLVDKMLEAWSSGSNLTGNDPFPSSSNISNDVEDVEDLVGSGASDDLTTHSADVDDAYDVNKRPLQIAEQPGMPEQANKPIPAGAPSSPESAPAASSPPKPSGGSDPSMSMDPSMNMDVSMGGGDPSMMDPSMMGAEQPGPADAYEVGRVYEMKKIHNRLVSIQSHLSTSIDVELVKLRNYVTNTLELYRTVISNLKLYKDRLDELIVVFYKVINDVYKILSKYYKDKDSKKFVKINEV